MSSLHGLSTDGDVSPTCEVAFTSFVGWVCKLRALGSLQLRGLTAGFDKGLKAFWLLSKPRLQHFRISWMP